MEEEKVMMSFSCDSNEQQRSKRKQVMAWLLTSSDSLKLDSFAAVAVAAAVVVINLCDKRLSKHLQWSCWE